MLALTLKCTLTGSGKSALLANWVLKRRATKHKDEFLFQHFVESSAQSGHLGHMLYRLETELKAFFQLREIEVPESEERLRWSLSRFLSAAVKKKFPARIVIVIDGVNKLKGAGCRDGELYWLPTELPPCVRFIVSTVEHEQHAKGSDEIIPHRTFAELMRRHCPVIRMEPLSIGIRHSIINSYVAQHPELDLQENQQFRAVTCASSAQPIFLRTLLESIRLGVLMTAYSVDSLIDIYLRCTTAYELVEKILEMCIASISNEAYVDMLGKVLTIVYVSRNGVTEEELWGIVKRVSKVEADAMHQQKFFAILKNFTMVVHGLHSFSHEVYRAVVYQKFIGNNDTYIRWHNVMARYFGQLPTCERKLTCLPYHLEVAGSWNKVKNCLTDIEMFNLWWTPNFKKDFIKYWSSLTAVRNSSNDSSASDDSVGPTGNNNSKKPTYDVVEEYVKSVEEYRSQKHPKDEVLADTILRVADFLMEFAVNGHEANADVPMNVHPAVLSSDLASLGVPHVEIDEEGRSVLVMPTMTVKKDDGTKSQGDAPVTANEDLPMCTTYYFARWMWIQYPLIALGNCDQRYVEGIRIRAANNPWERDNRRKKGGEGSLADSQEEDPGKKTKNHNLVSTSFELNQSGIVNSMKLPEIKFVKRCARSIRRATKADEEGEDVPDSTQLKIIGLQDTNRNLRDEFDFCCQQKMVLSRRLEEVKTQLRDLSCALESTGMYDSDLQNAIEKDKEVTQKLEKALFVNKNLRNLLNMCQRHPANSPATIFEVEKKLEQDAFIIKEIKARLWEQRFEHQVHNTSFKKMKQLVKSGVHMHTKLLELRYDKKKDLQTKQSLTIRDTEDLGDHMGLEETKSRRAKRQQSEGVSLEMFHEERAVSWQEKWQIITSRTGITDPEIFFQRLNNGGVLEDQINNLKRQSEARLNSLKNESMSMEAEMEEVRAEASILGGQSREIYEKHKELAAVQQTIRRAKEKAESAELLQQQVIAGLNHINELLGVTHTDREANIIDTIRDIEGVLETLVEENEKQQQGLGTGGTGGDSPGNFPRAIQGRDTGFNDSRPSELENVLQKYQDPKTRFVAAKATEDAVIVSGRDDMDDDYEDEGMWDRRFVKTQSQKTLRTLAKKRAAAGQPDLAATM